MKNLKVLSAISLIAVASSNYAEATSLNQMRSRMKKPKKERISESGQTLVGSATIASAVTGSSSSQGQTYQCTKDDQDSLPIRDFLNLLEYDELSVKHDPRSGLLRIEGGKMTNNCSSMFEPELIQPSGNIKDYLFKVKFKKPGNCADGKCTYKAYTSDGGGIANSEKMEVTVEPSIEGYYECLKLVGVFNEEGEFQEDKVVKSDFEFTTDQAKSTAGLKFYSHGPYGKQEDSLYGETGVKGGSCDVFDYINTDPKDRVLLSREDDYLRQKEREFQNVCDSNDYNLLDSSIENFSEFGKWQKDLERLRDQALIDEVKRLKKKLVNNQKDLSELDADKFERVLGDFHDYIIDPLRKQIADQYYMLKNADSDAEEKAAKDKLNRLTKKLLSFYQDKDFITIKDYELMKSFPAKAPLEKEKWRKAALNYYEGQATALAYGRYNQKYRAKMKEELVNPSVADQELEDYYADELKMVEMLGELAEDPDRSHASDYNKRISSLNRTIQLNNEDYQAYTQSASQYIRNFCYNPQHYWLNKQQCANDVMMDIQAEGHYNQKVNSKIGNVIQDYASQAQMWAAIEQSMGKTAAQAGNVPRATRGRYDFSFTPENTNHAANGQRYLAPYQQMPNSNQASIYRMPGSTNTWRMPGTTGFSINGNLSAGGSTGMWPNTMYSVQQNPNQAYWGVQQQQIPSAMMPYQSNYSNGAGSFTFTP